MEEMSRAGVPFAGGDVAQMADNLPGSRVRLHVKYSENTAIFEIERACVRGRTVA